MINSQKMILMMLLMTLTTITTKQNADSNDNDNCRPLSVLKLYLLGVCYPPGEEVFLRFSAGLLWGGGIGGGPIFWLVWLGRSTSDWDWILECLSWGRSGTGGIWSRISTDGWVWSWFRGKVWPWWALSYVLVSGEKDTSTLGRLRDAVEPTLRGLFFPARFFVLLDPPSLLRFLLNREPIMIESCQRRTLVTFYFLCDACVLKSTAQVSHRDTRVHWAAANYLKKRFSTFGPRTTSS